MSRRNSVGKKEEQKKRGLGLMRRAAAIDVGQKKGGEKLTAAARRIKSRETRRAGPSPGERMSRRNSVGKEQ